MADVQIALAAASETEVTVAVPGIQGPTGPTGDIAVAQDGTAATPGIRFESDPDTGIYRVGSNSIGISTGGTGRLFVNAIGNVGIGVANPGEALEVSGNITLAPNTGSFRVFGSSNGSDTTLLLQGGSSTGEGANIELGRDEVMIADASQHVFRSTDGASEKMRLDSSGRLGLGINGPTANLHAYNTSGNVTVRVQSGSNFGDFSHNGTDLFVSNTTGSTVFFFGVNERARITGDGKLGLGTSLPDEKCHIQDSTSAGTIKLGKDYYGILQQDSNNLNIVANGDQEYRVGLGTNNGTGNILFKTADGLTGNTTRMAITSTGVLQIADAGDIAVGTTTGTKIGTAANQKIGFYNTTPVVQPTTGVAEAAFVENSGGTAVNVDSTFGGYTIQQVVQALQSLGLLA